MGVSILRFFDNDRRFDSIIGATILRLLRSSPIYIDLISRLCEVWMMEIRRSDREL